jgi:hypothetical protein
MIFLFVARFYFQWFWVRFNFCKNQVVKLFNLLCLNLCHLCFFQDHESEIKAIYTGSEFWESASSVGGGIVLESTSFYVEQGGNLIGKCHGFYFFYVSEYYFFLTSDIRFIVLENDTQTAYHDSIVVYVSLLIFFVLLNSILWVLIF